MRKITAAVAIFGVLCTAGVTLAEQNLDDVVQAAKAKVKVTKSYEVGTTANFFLAQDEAALLEFTDNPTGVKEYLFWFDGEKVNFHCCSVEEGYVSHSYLTPNEQHYRIFTVKGGSGHIESSAEWERRDGKAAITFSAKHLSQADFQKLMKEKMEERWKKIKVPLEWDYEQEVAPLEIIMDDPDDPNMVRLREEYHLEEVVSGAADDYEKLRLLTKWVHDRWQHSGDNKPSKSDPLTILKEASDGKSFRCVEYAIVIAGCARALGMPSRVLALKRADVETAKSGAGHLVAEVWLRQFNKWVFADGQMDAIPEEDGVPLNAVEFQDAIARKAKDREGVGLNIRCSSKSKRGPIAGENYIHWVAPYLYYFDFNLDQRFFGESYEERRYSPVKGKTMLVPKGAKNPTVFQQKTPIKNCTYISNPKAFYPEMNE